MNREDIIRMAWEAWYLNGETVPSWHELERFAALVAAAERERIIEKNAPVIEQINTHIKELEAAVAAEREACAKVCEQEAFRWPPSRDFTLCAAAIRARSQA